MTFFISISSAHIEINVRIQVEDLTENDLQVHCEWCIPADNFPTGRPRCCRQSNWWGDRDFYQQMRYNRLRQEIERPKSTAWIDSQTSFTSPSSTRPDQKTEKPKGLESGDTQWGVTWFVTSWLLISESGQEAYKAIQKLARSGMVLKIRGIKAPRFERIRA